MYFCGYGVTFFRHFLYSPFSPSITLGSGNRLSEELKEERDSHLSLRKKYKTKVDEINGLRKNHEAALDEVNSQKRRGPGKAPVLSPAATSGPPGSSRPGSPTRSPAYSENQSLLGSDENWPDATDFE